jgi:hypothetical protein
MTKRRAYLSGGMEYADGEGAGWRGRLQTWIEGSLDHSVFNPNTESDRFFASRYPGVDFRKLKADSIGDYAAIVRQLVDIDSKEIAERSDYVVCYWDEGAAKGAGTKGELTIARFFQKPVYLVTSFAHRDIPGWVLGCTTRIFADFEELKRFLSSEAHHP